MEYSIENLRRNYQGLPLSEENLSKDPLIQFTQWFEQALEIDEEPNAMILSTVSPLGHPTSRAVLLKGFDKKGFYFFTNASSRKVEQMEINPNVAAMFLWKSLHQQIRIEGTVVKLSRKIVENYFNKRPRGFQIASHASSQSEPLGSREALEERYLLLQNKYRKKKVPCPKNWTGYRIVPHRYEFWQGQKNRLHDRFLYVLIEKKWIMSRLSP